MMKYSKHCYRNLHTVNDFHWAFWEDRRKLHTFVKPVPDGVITIRVTEEDIDDGSHLIMMEKEITR